jgi:hypothetical protein
MVPFAIPAALSGALKHWKLAAFGLLLLALAVQTVRHQRAVNRADRAEFNLAESRAGRIADRKAYEEAQKAAAAKNIAEVQRITTEQEKISHERESNVVARLERLRRELRAQNAAPGGSPGRPAASPDGNPAEDPAGAARVCLAPSVILRAAENEERHDQLIRWVEEQLRVKR